MSSRRLPRFSDDDGSGIAVVRLNAQRRYGIKQGYGVKCCATDHYRTCTCLKNHAAWVRFPAAAARFADVADAAALARATAEGEDPPNGLVRRLMRAGKPQDEIMHEEILR